jgi:hypothetical protein
MAHVSALSSAHLISLAVMFELQNVLGYIALNDSMKYKREA